MKSRVCLGKESNFPVKLHVDVSPSSDGSEQESASKPQTDAAINVNGLENSTAGTSTTTGVINGPFIQNVENLTIQSGNHSSQEQQEQFSTGAQHHSPESYPVPHGNNPPNFFVNGSSSDDQRRLEQMTEWQEKAIPTRTAFNKAIDTYKNNRVTGLVGNCFEGEYFIITKLCENPASCKDFEDINGFAEQYHELPKDNRLVIVVRNIPDVIRDMNKLADILATIKSDSSASECKRKYIFICQPWSLKSFKRKMAIDIFHETNTVNLTELNGHLDQWQERLALMDKFKCRELDQHTKDRIAKMTPPVGGFPYLCASYNGQGPCFFEKPNQFARQQFDSIISSHGLITTAAFIMIVACKGSCNDNYLRKGYLLKEFEQIIKADMHMYGVTVELLWQQLECWKAAFSNLKNAFGPSPIRYGIKNVQCGYMTCTIPCTNTVIARVVWGAY